MFEVGTPGSGWYDTGSYSEDGWRPTPEDEAEVAAFYAAVTATWDGEPRAAANNLTFETIDPRGLGDYELVEYVKTVEAQRRHLDGVLAEALAVLVRRSVFEQCAEPDDVCGAHVHSGDDHDPFAAAADEVAPAMMWTTGYATDQVQRAVGLAEELPDTLAAIRAGKIDSYRAKVICDQTRSLAEQPEVRARVEAAALRVAEGKTAPQLREYVKRRMMAADPDAVELRRERAQQSRGVSKPCPEADGMASMTLFGPAESLGAFWTALDAAARARRDAAAKAPGGPDHGLGLGQLRFDVVSDLAFSALNAGHLGCCGFDCPGLTQRFGTQHGVHAHIIVRMSDITAAGLDDLPAELEGFGPIPAEAARRLAGDATWRRLLTDPVSGALLDYGRTVYEPPQALRDFVIARDRTCRMPVCTWPASSADLDHTPAWNDGGQTSPSGMGPLHRRHHNSKTHHGCRLEQPEPGRFVWVSATGHAYPVDPEIIDNFTLLRDGDSTSGDPPV